MFCVWTGRISLSANFKSIVPVTKGKLYLVKYCIAELRQYFSGNQHLSKLNRLGLEFVIEPFLDMNSEKRGWRFYRPKG